MTTHGADIACLEGESGYDVRWPWNHPEEVGPLSRGLTCVFRVKDEARNLPWVLPPMLAAVDHVVLVDNGSTDGTGEVARRVAEQEGALDRFTGLTYPHRVARAGAEHLATPPRSVHSLTHFYNWSFSHVRTTYSMKWDGDMVLTPEGVAVLRDLAWQLQDTGSVVAVPRHPVTVVSEQEAWVDLGFRFLEPWIYPMGPDHTYVKAFEWEVREFPLDAPRVVAPEGLTIELKWLDLDEFAHWSSITDDAVVRAPRKRRELSVQRALLAGEGDRVEGLHRVVAPAGVHVVDHIVHDWLARRERPLVVRPSWADA